MDLDTLNKLKASATETRDLAHKAYEVALKDSSSSEAAYRALLQANQTLRQVSDAIIAAVL